MEQKVISEILKDPASFSAYRDLYNSHQSVIKKIVEDKLIHLLENYKNSDLEVFFEKEKLLNYSAEYKSFYFLNKALRDLNLKIVFFFNSASGYSKFSFSIDRLNNDRSAINLSKIKDFFILSFGNGKPIESWRCYSDYNNYNNWEDPNTLQKIWFGNDFEEDMKQKIEKLFEIIEKIKSGEIK